MAVAAGLMTALTGPAWAAPGVAAGAARADRRSRPAAPDRGADDHGARLTPGHPARDPLRGAPAAPAGAARAGARHRRATRPTVRVAIRCGARGPRTHLGAPGGR